MKNIVFIVCIFLSMQIFAQDYFIPRNVKAAYEKGTRTYTGEPGENYWQNSSDYQIKVKFNPFTRMIDGTESIRYFNNSPDSLKEIVIRLYPNYFRKNAIRNRVISAESINDGIQLSEIKIRDEIIDLMDKSTLLFTSTNLIIKLKEKIPPGSSTDFFIDWSYEISIGYPERTGIYDSTSFLIAYWYPQISVYDDIDGWDKIDFNGEQEMYNDFNNYDVEIEVPDRFMVWSTGVLQNANEIFSSTLLDRYELAHSSEKVINIIKKEDYQSGIGLLSGKGSNIWHIKAENVSDFTFACSDHYLWDAISLVIDNNSARKVFISAAYNPDSKDFYAVAEIAKNAINYFSTDLPGVPFPYPSFTVFNGGGGMEFPMIINDGSTSSFASALSLTAHETAHTYFPFYMGINEKKYAWMDEGLAVMLPMKFQSSIEENDPLGRNAASFSYYAGTEMEMSPIIPSNLLRGTAYRTASYTRPALAYYFLMDFLGRDKFRGTLQEYMSQWNGKHPIPYDFFKIFNAYLKEDLNWYWKPWFFESGVPDLGIKEVKMEKSNVKVCVEKFGNIPVPIELYFVDVNQRETRVYKSAKVWASGEKKIWIEEILESKLIEIRLGSSNIPDVDISNNILHFD